MSVSSDPESSTGRNVAMLYHGTWPVERAMWNSEPPNLNHHNSNINQAVSIIPSKSKQID